jgi:hypothetical protein
MSSKLAALAMLAVYFPWPAFSLPSNSPATTNNAVCQDYTIPVTVGPEIYFYNATIFKNNYDLTDFVIKSSSVNSTDVFFPVEKHHVVQTFHLEVHGTFCRPANIPAGQKSTAISATHGIGVDGSYQDSSYKPQKYNFIHAAAKQGYSVFYYDRIGNGNSTK